MCWKHGLKRESSAPIKAKTPVLQEIHSVSLCDATWTSSPALSSLGTMLQLAILPKSPPLRDCPLYLNLMLKSEESWERKEVVVWGLAPPPQQWFKIKEHTRNLELIHHAFFPSLWHLPNNEGMRSHRKATLMWPRSEYTDPWNQKTKSQKASC